MLGNSATLRRFTRQPPRHPTPSPSIVWTMTTDEIRVRLRHVAEHRGVMAAADRSAADALHEAILDALDVGIGATEIATITGLARSRIYQIKEQQR